MADVFLGPGRIFSGRGALDLAADLMGKLGKKALVVTDSVMEKLGNLERVTDTLSKAGAAWAVYTGIDGEPDDGMIERGVKVYIEEGCDFLVGLGGGSPIDSMKAIAMIVRYGGRPGDYMGKLVTGVLPPMVAVPTTAGTGSEATQFTIITDRTSQVKMLLKGPALMPDVAVIDPHFMMTVPRRITAATGADALTHALEAYTSRRAQPLSDTFALSACDRIFRFLKKAWEDGEDEESRVQMSLAALEAGIAFNNSSVTIIHGMSRPIGALFHVPHGISNAMLLQVCLEYIVDGVEERFGDIAIRCGFAEADEGKSQAARKVLKAVKRLLDDIAIPGIRDYGISREQFFESIPKMARDAYASGSPSNTRKEITVEVMEELYRKLW
ncbi:MAG: iron-containing alcohol dehydrogenase [Hungatella sp.]|jgi:alcohol dehydrogenase class IV|nr:iron-containing alcohol dehydrogenase [Hungatella sp.]